MKLSIKHSENCPIGTQQQRRVLATLNFEKHGIEPLCSYKPDRNLVPINGEGSLVLEEASFTPSNRVFSIIVGYRTRKEQTNIFATIFEFKAVPTYFSFLLPNGQFVEFYLEDTVNKK